MPRPFVLRSFVQTVRNGKTLASALTDSRARPFTGPIRTNAVRLYYPRSQRKQAADISGGGRGNVARQIAGAKAITASEMPDPARKCRTQIAQKDEDGKSSQKKKKKTE